MADQTPNPIDVLRSWWFAADYCSQPEPFEVPVSQSILDALTAAGFQVVPIVDDATRQEVEAIEWALRHVPTAVGSGVRSRAAELLAAAYLGRND